MAEIRFNYGDKFTQTSDSNTGIGSTIPAAKLDIAGGTSAGSLRVSGIATLSSYQGFVNTKLTPPTEGMIVEAGQSGSVSGEIVVGTGQTISVSTGATTGQGGIQSLKVYETFMPPVGGTADRPTDVKPGMVYYNKDFKTIEFWDGNFWKQVDNTTTSSRAIFFGGYHQPTYSSGYNGLTVDFFNMSSGGSSQNFGEYANRRTNTAGSGNAIRGISACGFDGPGNYGTSNSIEYITIASSGNVIDFGDRTVSGYGGNAVSSSTRSVFLGVRDTPAPGDKDECDYIEISTIGNAVDFGDLIANGGYKAGNLNSPIRGFVAGGQGPLGTNSNDIQMITIASKGNAIRTGDIPRITDNSTGASNSVRGIISGGNAPTSPNTVNAVIADLYFLNLASQGDAFSFGDLTASRQRCGGTANGTRAIFAGGFSYPGSVVVSDSIDNVTISTTGSAVDFGTLAGGKHQFGATSDSHGGLGGF